MTKALIRVRFRALFHTMLRQSQQKRRRGRGMTVLFMVLFAYVAVVFCGLFGLMFSQLAPAYHGAGLDWLYFATAGLMALALSVFGSVFATQSQIYDAKDNALLLSMPIRPRTILLSRILPLIVLTGVFAAVVLGPAGVVYGLQVGYTPLRLVSFLLCALAVPFLAQALCCLLGWLLHQMLNRINKSVASAVYMILFLALYFYIYSQAGEILNAMAANSQSMASALRSWAWPLYAMGQACTGNLLHLAAYLAVCAGLFGLAYWFLSATFLSSAAMQRTGRRRKVDYQSLRAGSALQALMGKERKRFVGCPVYFTNMGLGLVFILALAVAGVIFRRQVLEFFCTHSRLCAPDSSDHLRRFGIFDQHDLYFHAFGLSGGQVHLDSQVVALVCPADFAGKAAVPQPSGGSRVHGCRPHSGPGLRLQPGGCGVYSPDLRPFGPSVRTPGHDLRPSVGPAGLADGGASL